MSTMLAIPNKTEGQPALTFLRKFWGLSAWMLELIMVLSAVLGNYSDLAPVRTCCPIGSQGGVLFLRFIRMKPCPSVVSTA